VIISSFLRHQPCHLFEPGTAQTSGQALIKIINCLRHTGVGIGRRQIRGRSRQFPRLAPLRPGQRSGIQEVIPRCLAREGYTAHTHSQHEKDEGTALRQDPVPRERITSAAGE
jgi:hypothetical protein